MRLRCNMRFTFDGVTIHEVGEVIERDYEEVKNAIRDHALIPLPDLPPVIGVDVANGTDSTAKTAQNAYNAAVKQPITTVNVAEVMDAVSKAPASPSDTSEVKEG